MSEYIITCISHARAENIPNLFEKVGTDEITFFVKDGDQDNYYMNGAKNVIISGSLMDSRNSALKYAFSNFKICVQLSDDIEKTAVNDFSGKRTKKYVKVIDAIDGVMEHFLNSPCAFGGFPPTDNPFFALKEFEYDKFIVGDFILIKPCNLIFDTNLRLKEDYDYTLQHIKYLHGSVRYGKYLNTFKHYSNSGGAVDYRNDDLEQKTIMKLQEKWGDCIKLNTKRKNEILLARNCKAIMDSPKLF